MLVSSLLERQNLIRGMFTAFKRAPPIALAAALALALTGTRARAATPQAGDLQPGQHPGPGGVGRVEHRQPPPLEHHHHSARPGSQAGRAPAQLHGKGSDASRPSLRAQVHHQQLAGRRRVAHRVHRSDHCVDLLGVKARS